MGNIIPAGGQAQRDTVLVVDDTPENLVLLSRILQPEGYKVMTFPDGKRALEALKADPATAAIPIIFISALSEPLDKVKTFDAGAVDYITKPLNLREWWLFWVDYSLTAKGLGREPKSLPQTVLVL